MDAISAILCSTDSDEPWAAKVSFEVDGLSWLATLNTGFTHYQNLRQNQNATIVFSDNEIEIIAKARALMPADTCTENIRVTFKIHWLRLVHNKAVSDHDDPEGIKQVIVKYLSLQSVS